MVYNNPPVASRPSRLEQTIFIVLASLAGLAFVVIITLLLCKFQCQVGDSNSNRGSGDNCEVHTATTSTSPLSARELVEISLLHTNNDADMNSGLHFLHQNNPPLQKFYLQIQYWSVYQHQDLCYPHILSSFLLTDSRKIIHQE